MPLMYRLSFEGYRLFAVDQCGQNETRGVDDPTAYLAPSLARDLSVALTAAAARRPVHLVGHGAGAVVAATAVAAEPEKYRSLTLLGPWWNSDFGTDGAEIADWERLAAAQHRGGTMSDERRSSILQRLRRSHPLSLEGLARLAAESDLVHKVRASGVPLLVARGAEDVCVLAPRTEDLALQLGARHGVVAQAGHLPHHDNPDGLARTLAAFWRQADA